MTARPLSRRAVLKAAALTGVAGAAGYCGVRAFGTSKRPDFARAHTVSAHPVVPTPGFAGKRPNIVLINCDDLGAGDIGCYGSTAIRTPNIDRLATAGMRFTDYDACASVCTPSRFGLLTGRYPVRSGLNYILYQSRESMARKLDITLWHWLGRLGAVDAQDESYVNGLPDEEVTLPEALKVAGYRTGMVGKWHLGDFSKEPRYNPRRHGFDSFYGVPHSNDMVPCALYRGETRLEDDIGTNQARLTGLYTREALDFIDAANGAPFFLYLAHTFPHQPLYASERFKGKSAAGIYGDAVEELDWSVGAVMTHLAQQGLDKDTLVLFTSDNGPWYNGSPAGLRGRKGQSYEGGHRVPLIARWPGQIPAGATCRESAMNIDLFPTLLPLAGLQLPSDRAVDGKNIIGLMTGRATQTPHDVLYFYHSEELEGIRVGSWKYYRSINHYVFPRPIDKRTTVLGSQDRGNLGTWPNLYDLATDPTEAYDLASGHPDVVARMERLMADWESRVKVNPGGWFP